MEIIWIKETIPMKHGNLFCFKTNFIFLFHIQIQINTALIVF